uniref:uncharacterized protein LOC120340354 n=1 Tax=Styela clava TaxID=7725 RepID=UPI00193AA365|nr:uncharacterized protein LOC120340354 [Styela clava]
MLYNARCSSILLLAILYGVLGLMTANSYVGKRCSPRRLYMLKDGQLVCDECGVNEYWSRQIKKCSLCTSPRYTNLKRNIRSSCKDHAKSKIVPTSFDQISTQETENSYVGTPCASRRLYMLKNGQLVCDNCGVNEYWSRQTKTCSLCTSPRYTNLMRNVRSSCKDHIKPRTVPMPNYTKISTIQGPNDSTAKNPVSSSEIFIYRCRYIFTSQ